MLCPSREKSQGRACEVKEVLGLQSITLGAIECDRGRRGWWSCRINTKDGIERIESSSSPGLRQVLGDDGRRIKGKSSAVERVENSG